VLLELIEGGCAEEGFVMGYDVEDMFQK